MKGLIIANDFYVSKFLMKGMDRDVLTMFLKMIFIVEYLIKPFLESKLFGHLHLARTTMFWRLQLKIL